jgi:hypothetical protein
VVNRTPRLSLKDKGDAVSELDRVREKIAYLKFWQGIMVVTDISLLGWLLTTSDTSSRVVMGGVAVVLLTLGILALHRQIDRRIDQTSRL